MAELMTGMFVTRAHQFAVETAIREKGGLRGGRPYASLSFARRLASSRRLV